MQYLLLDQRLVRACWPQVLPSLYMSFLLDREAVFSRYYDIAFGFLLFQHEIQAALPMTAVQLRNCLQYWRRRHCIGLRRGPKLRQFFTIRHHNLESFVSQSLREKGLELSLTDRAANQ